MRIGTWNTEYARGAEKNAARLRCIREAACDIWVLTETSDDLDLGPGYAHVSTGPRPGRRAGEQWTTIWSRYPIVERVPLADACRTVAALVDSPLRALVVYGTVLPWHSDRGPERDAATRVPKYPAAGGRTCPAVPGLDLTPSKRGHTVGGRAQRVHAHLSGGLPGDAS